MIRLRRRLLSPVLLAVLLMAILFSCALVKVWTFQRDQIVARHAEVVRTVALAISRDLETTTMHLRHMATSPWIAPGSLGVFDDRCREVLAQRPDWEAMELYERSGKVLISTRLPRGATLAHLPPPGHVADAFSSGEPRVSGAYIAPQVNQWRIGVAVPVKRGGETAYVLSVSLSPEAFDDLLRARTAGSGGAAALFDSDLRFIARSAGASTVRGELARQPSRGRMQEAQAGQGETRTIEGTAVLSVWEPVGRAGWTVAIGIPTGAAYAALWPVLLVLVVCACAALGGTILLALRTSRRVASAIEGAAAQAAALAQGKPVAVARTGIVELDELGEALVKSSDRIAAGERERSQLLESERRARSEAERANQAKDEFLAMLGHELRNPLASVSHAAQLLSLSNNQPPASDNVGDILSRQVAHMKRLVDDLLDAGRVTGGKITLVREPLELAGVVAQLTATWRSGGRFLHHEVRTQFSPVWVRADRARVEQVISNLLDNALKYTPEGGTIVLAVRQEGSEALLVLSDSGQGMPPELMARAFELFAQGDRSLAREGGGLGIGLTLVRRLVELHGGTVLGESAGSGRGSTFTVRLPAIEKGFGAAVRTPPAPTLGARRILVIEDNDDARDSLAALLRFSGHEIRTAPNGMEGIAAAGAFLPELALVDIGLPDLDGYEIARELRSDPATRSIRLVAMTGYGLPEDRRRALDAGFDEHLAKPAELASLEVLFRALAAAAA